MWLDHQRVEVFHLGFLRGLVRALDGSTFVLKGGCNFRYFFGSPRYSEDVDIDVEGVTALRLKEATMGVLTSTALGASLRTFGIGEVRPRLHKQTETVQRFKVMLLTPAGHEVPTKVEFSRRGFDGHPVGEAVRAEILAAYGLPPLVLPHYDSPSAFAQKLRAVLDRRVPQARDVFDLRMLSDAIPEPGRFLDPDERRRVTDTILSMDYDAYRCGVLDFLPPDDRASWEGGRTWDELRLRVVDALHGR